MINEISECLDGISTPEYKSVAIEAIQTFDLFDYTEHEQELLNAVLGEDSTEESVQLQEIHFVIENHLRSLLKMHAIELNEEATLEQLTTVLRAIYLMQSWEDKTELNMILEQDASPEEIFAELVKTTTGLSMEETMGLISEFEPGVNERLADLIKGEIVIEDDEMVSYEQLVRLKNFNLFMNNEKLIGIRLIRLGYRIGAPFSFYFNRVQRHFPAMQAEQQATEFLTLLLMSRDSWMMPTQAFNDIAPTLNFDLNETTQIDNHLKQLWNKFQQFSSSN